MLRFYWLAGTKRAVVPRRLQALRAMEEVQAIQAAREESAEKRKELVEQVKQLKAADDVGRLALLNTTMRAFQKEVERLSSRAMFAEAAFERLHEQASLNQGAQEGGATLQAAMTEKEELREKLEVSAVNPEHAACTLHMHCIHLPGQCDQLRAHCMHTSCTRHVPPRRSRRSSPRRRCRRRR